MKLRYFSHSSFQITTDDGQVLLIDPFLDDMKQIGEMTPLDYMLLPISDNFTMAITDAVKAVELANPKVAIPMHYNTFPVIEADPNTFKKQVETIGKKAIVMEFGQEIKL